MSELEYFIQQMSELEDAHSPEGRTKRFALMMDSILEKLEGNIIEIGAGFGNSTKVFLESAEKFGRHVWVFDPFLDPVYPREEFDKKVEGFPNLILIDASSQDFSRITFKPCFAFADGLQTKEGVLHDLKLCSEAKII